MILRKGVSVSVLCLVLAFIGVVKADAWWWSSESVNIPYVTSEDTVERVAEDIIREVWGAENNWQQLDESLPTARVVSIRSIPQINGTLALDMRVRLERQVTESELIFKYLDKVQELMPKLLSEGKLKGHDEFRLFGSLPMMDIERNISESGITKLALTRTLAQKITWDQANGYDLHHYLMRLNAAKKCTYWIHGGILSQAKWLK